MTESQIIDMLTSPTQQVPRLRRAHPGQAAQGPGLGRRTGLRPKLVRLDNRRHRASGGPPRPGPQPARRLMHCPNPVSGTAGDFGNTGPGSSRAQGRPAP